jgi:CelD/BcsL family acetyltransferase involved in cellulose biosynthesis
VRVQRFDNLNDLLPYRDAWDRLAGGMVFRSWTWLTAWWRHYGEGHPERSLYVLIALDDDAEATDMVRGILPAYVESTWTQGRVLRLLGDGEVCSDHLGLLTASLEEVDKAVAIAREIADDQHWELLEFTAIDEDDAPTQRLLDELAECDCMISRTPTDRCWAIDLPATWDEFLALQSKSHRKQLRQLERRVLESLRAEWRLVETSDAFGDAWSTLVDLHQRRRQSLGEPGCFASPTWAAFHWDVAQQLLAQGSLRLSTLQLDGRPIAAEYHFAGNGTTWAYQGGVDPARLTDEPGQLSTIRSIQHAIAEGHSHFDLLRGDEPYKAHWRAAPTQDYELAAVPNRLWPRLRRGAYSGAKNLRHATRQLTGMFS